MYWNIYVYNISKNQKSYLEQDFPCTKEKGERWSALVFKLIILEKQTLWDTFFHPSVNLKDAYLIASLESAQYAEHFSSCDLFQCIK